MVKSALVIISLIFCAGALFAPPPSPRDVAEWREIVLQSAYGVGRSLLTVVQRAMPSADDVARYARDAGLLAQRAAVNVLDRLAEPEAREAAVAPPAVTQPAITTPHESVAAPECR